MEIKMDIEAETLKINNKLIQIVDVEKRRKVIFTFTFKENESDEIIIKENQLFEAYVLPYQQSFFFCKRIDIEKLKLFLMRKKYPPARCLISADRKYYSINIAKIHDKITFYINKNGIIEFNIENLKRALVADLEKEYKIIFFNDEVKKYNHFRKLVIKKLKNTAKELLDTLIRYRPDSFVIFKTSIKEQCEMFDYDLYLYDIEKKEFKKYKPFVYEMLFKKFYKLHLHLHKCNYRKCKYLEDASMKYEDEERFYLKRFSDYVHLPAISMCFYLGDLLDIENVDPSPCTD